MPKREVATKTACAEKGWVEYFASASPVLENTSAGRNIRTPGSELTQTVYRTHLPRRSSQYGAMPALRGVDDTRCRPAPLSCMTRRGISRPNSFPLPDFYGSSSASVRPSVVFPSPLRGNCFWQDGREGPSVAHLAALGLKVQGKK